MKKNTSDLKKKCVDAWVQLAQKYCEMKRDPKMQLMWDIFKFLFFLGKVLIFLIKLYMNSK